MNGALATFKAQLAADRKKAVLLGVLALVFVGAVANALIGKAGPQPAEAELAIVPPIQSPPPPVSRDPALKRPTAVQNAPQPRGHHPGAVASAASAATPDDPLSGESVSVAGISRRPARDPFSVADWTAFRTEGPSSPAAVEPGGDAVQTTRTGGESGVDAAAEAERLRAEQLEEEKKALAGLVLQSTLIGSVRSAHISGRLVYEGESIAGFEVVRIRGGEVTLRKDGRLHALLMR